jgi:hypothetical protein
LLISTILTFGDLGIQHATSRTNDLKLRSYSLILIQELLSNLTAVPNPRIGNITSRSGSIADNTGFWRENWTAASNRAPGGGGQVLGYAYKDGDRGYGEVLA